jgi:hypothetical protein
MGYGKTRFASPIDAFKVLYVAENLDTAIAEAIIRDRFEGRTRRRFTEEEACDWGVTEVTAKRWLTLIDLRTTGPFRLGVPTNAVQGKNQKRGRHLSQAIYDGTDADGILYPSRLTRATCVAVYNRAVEPNLTATPVQEIVTLADFVPALKRLDVTLIRARS